ncbi:Tripartite tricarboxylate transporter family receptor [compost metagenome]
MAPPGTPAAIVDVIAAETAKVMRQPEVRKKLQGMGAQSESLGPTGFSRLITEESARWSAITRDAGVVRQNI